MLQQLIMEGVIGGAQLIEVLKRYHLIFVVSKIAVVHILQLFESDKRGDDKNNADRKLRNHKCLSHPCSAFRAGLAFQDGCRSERADYKSRIDSREDSDKYGGAQQVKPHAVVPHIQAQRFLREGIKPTDRNGGDAQRQCQGEKCYKQGFT